MADELVPSNLGEFLLYQTDDGTTRVQVRIEGNTVWLSQRDMADLFQTTPQNVTIHIGMIYEEGELVEAATCKDCLQVRRRGTKYRLVLPTEEELRREIEREHATLDERQNAGKA